MQAWSPTSWRSVASCRRPHCCSPDTSRDDPWQADRDYRLTVLTMQGMTLPRPGSPREEWTDAESLAVELLNLASWLTQRTIYDADRNLRKGVALDETHFLSQVPTGKVLIDRLARDSRKFNVRALFASQLAGDLLRVSGFASLVNAVFVGRTDDEQAQSEALRLLRVPTGVGYEQMLGTLSPRPRHDDRPDDTPRQFVFADGHGGVEKIRIDLEAPHLEHVREALDTNPDASRIAVSGIPGAAALRAPDEPAPLGAVADQRTEAARRAVRARNGAGYVAPLPAVDAELLDDEDLDLFDDLDDVPVEGGPSAGNGNGNGGSVPGPRRGVPALRAASRVPGGPAVTSGLPVLRGAGGRDARRARPIASCPARGGSGATAPQRRPADRHGPDRGDGTHRDAGVRAEHRVQGGSGAGPAGDGARGVAGSPDPERGRAGQRLQRGRLRRHGLAQLRPRLRRHRLQPGLHHGHLAGQPGVQRREVRGRRGQLVALPDLRGRQPARAARRRDPRRDVRRCTQAVFTHVDRSRAGRALGHPARARRPR